MLGQPVSAATDGQLPSAQQNPSALPTTEAHCTHPTPTIELSPSISHLILESLLRMENRLFRLEQGNEQMLRLIIKHCGLEADPSGYTEQVVSAGVEDIHQFDPSHCHCVPSSRSMSCASDTKDMAERSSQEGQCWHKSLLQSLTCSDGSHVLECSTCVSKMVNQPNMMSFSKAKLQKQQQLSSTTSSVESTSFVHSFEDNTKADNDSQNTPNVQGMDGINVGISSSTNIHSSNGNSVDSLQNDSLLNELSCSSSRKGRIQKQPKVCALSSDSEEQVSSSFDNSMAQNNITKLSDSGGSAYGIEEQSPNDCSATTQLTKQESLQSSVEGYILSESDLQAQNILVFNQNLQASTSDKDCPSDPTATNFTNPHALNCPPNPTTTNLTNPHALNCPPNPTTTNFTNPHALNCPPHSAPCSRGMQHSHKGLCRSKAVSSRNSSDLLLPGQDTQTHIHNPHPNLNHPGQGPQLAESHNLNPHPNLNHPGQDTQIKESHTLNPHPNLYHRGQGPQMAEQHTLNQHPNPNHPGQGPQLTHTTGGSVVTGAQTQEELPVTEELIVSCTAQTLESELTEEYLSPEEMTDVGMAAIDSVLEEEVQISRDVNLTGPARTTAQQMALDQDRSTLQKFWVQLTKLDHSLLLHLFAVNIRDNSQTIRDFLDVIMRSMSTDVHQRLWNGVAGIEPDLFANVFGFSPSREEKDFIISDFVEKLKAVILECSVTRADKVGDRSIELDTDYIQLRVFGERDGKRSNDRRPGTQRQTSSDGDSSEDDISSDYDDEDDDTRRYAAEELELEEETDWNVPDHQQLRERDGQQADRAPEDLLKENGQPLTQVLVLVKGRPGVGKTTTSEYLLRRWAQGRFTGRTFSVFFLVHVRHLIHVKDTEMTLVQLLSLYCRSARQAGGLPAYIGAWMENNQESVLLGIDGLDEMPDFAGHFDHGYEVTSVHAKARPFDLLISLLKRKLLPSATVIGLSRTFTLLRQVAFDRIVEIQGLTLSGIIQYVRRFAPPDRVEDIIKVLERNPTLMSVCHVTVYCMLICSAMADDVTLNGLDLQTYTRIYSFIITSYLRRSDQGGQVGDRSSVGLRYSGLLHTLSALALTSFTQRPVKMVYTGHDLDGAKVNLPEVVRTGLMSVDADVPGPDHDVTIASYLHLSIQEFLGSAMATQLHPEKLKEFISEELMKGQFEMALLFCFGHVFDRKSTNIKQIHEGIEAGHPPTSPVQPAGGWKAKEAAMTDVFRSILESDEIDSRDGVRLAVLAHESQDPSLAKVCARGLMQGAALEFSDTPMTVVDMMSVMFVVQYAKNLKELCLQQCGVDAACVRLMDPFLTADHGLKKLDLRGNELGDEGTAVLMGLLVGSRSLKLLNLSYNRIGDAGLNSLAAYVKNSHSLKSLLIEGNHFGDNSVDILVQGALHMNTLRTIDLGDNHHVTDQSTSGLMNLVRGAPAGSTLRVKNTGMSRPASTKFQQEASKYPNIKVIM